MKNTPLYVGFAIATMVEVAMFTTTTTYNQYAIAAILYLPLVYVFFKLFPRKPRQKSSIIQSISKSDTTKHTITEDHIAKGIDISDIDKRAFLKLVVVMGLSFFISSLFFKRAGKTILGKAEEPGQTTLKDAAGNIINPAQHNPTDNYKISEVDYGTNTYYGFMDQGEGWFIMKEDLNTGTYRYIKGNSNFYKNWSNRENLKYDYFNRVFPKS